MHAVEVEGLTKRFGATQALRGVDLAVEPATVLGLLGPNGSGKTTTVRILSTLLAADGGRAMVDGIDVMADPGRVRSRIGLTGQYAAVDERLTGRENIEHVARLSHLGRRDARRRSGELLDRFDLGDAADRLAGGYSGGMRRRLDIAMSLVAEPAVLFLDEPTTGLDPRGRLSMWTLIEELVADGTTTLLTTQYLEEAERLADSIVVLDRGSVIADGTVDELKARIGGDRLAVTVTRAADLDRAFATLVRERLVTAGTEQLDRAGRTVTVALVDTHAVVPTVVRLLDHAGIETDDVMVRRPTLDDVFLQLTGHVASDDDPGPTDDRAPVEPAAAAPPAPDPGEGFDKADEILRLLGEHARTTGVRPASDAEVELTLQQLDARRGPRPSDPTDPG
ncbi:MAG TPA: ATP-binding cassette domain-containing protein [Acidimicrobiales bacterium]